MFNNIGGKIKGIVKIICWIGIICSCIIGFALMSLEEDIATIAGLVIIVVGSFSAWLNSLLVYGFGQLVENSDKIASEKKKKPSNNNTSNNQVVETPPAEEKPIYIVKTLNHWKAEGLISEEDYDQKISDPNSMKQRDPQELSAKIHDIESRLAGIRSAYNSGLISEDEYLARKEALIKKL